MRSLSLKCRALAAGLLVSGPALQAAEFDINVFAEAQKNAQSEEGKAYDAKLTKGFEAQPKFLEGVQACLKAHPGKHQINGYFSIPPTAQYEVVLMPKTPLSECLTKTMMGYRVPKPPQLPWVNVFYLDNTKTEEQARTGTPASSATSAPVSAPTKP